MVLIYRYFIYPGETREICNDRAKWESREWEESPNIYETSYNTHYIMCLRENRLDK